MPLRRWMQAQAANRLFDANTPPPQAYGFAIVLGAAVTTTGEPTPVLAARLDAAVAVHAGGWAARLLLSGDDGRRRMDEISAMYAYLEHAGLPVSQVLVDGGAHRTLASIEAIPRSLGPGRILLISQREHLCRALWLADQARVAADGWVAPEVLLSAAGRRRNERREAVSRLRAVLEAPLTKARAQSRAQSWRRHRS